MVVFGEKVMKRLLVVSQRDNSLWGIEFSQKRKGEYTCSDVRSLDFKDLAGKRDVIIVTDIQPFHYIRERVTKGPPEAIRVQLLDRIERLGIFRHPPEIFYKLEREEGMYVECSTCAVDQSQLNLLTDKFINHRVVLKSLFHRAISTAALILDQYPNESTIAVYGDEKGGYITITDSAGIRYIRSLKFDEFMGLSEASIREEIDLAVGQYRRTTGADVTKLLASGAVRKVLPDVDFPRTLKWCPTASEEDIAEYPELFGALLTPPDFTMLPHLWISWNKHLTWAKKIAMVMTIVAIINGALAGYLFKTERKMRAETSVKAQMIKTKSEELFRRIPVEKLKFVDAYKDTLEAFKREPKMDEFIIWLARIIPSNFKITNMSIKKPSPQPSGGAAPQPGVPSVGAHPAVGTTPPQTGGAGVFSVTLSIGAVTNFEEAHQVFKHILEAVHSHYAVARSSFRFNDRENTTECSFELKL